jgi:tripartite-type tricarboxylate transporter receptor subunit TctC
MRRIATLLATAFIAAMPAAQAQAPAFPDKPIVLVVPFPPGGPTDAMARTLAAEMRDKLGQPMVVENRAGAGGNIGADFVARAPADGQTLLFGTSGPLAINASLYRKISYDPIKSFAPVIQVGHLPNILVVHPGVPAQNVKELVAHAKANPGKLSYASSGNGASSHLAGVLFNEKAGVDLQHIPYKGTGPALTDLLGGHIPMAFAPIPASHSNVSAGKLRALAVTSIARSGLLPDVPTMIEAGLSGFDASLYYGLVAPAGTPRPIVDKLNKALRDALASDEVKKQLGNDGTEITPGTPEDYADFIDKDEKKWSQLVKASGVEQE